MTKLIIEEGGRRREFRLGEGTLTLGSGVGARLRLDSRELADVHLELQIGPAGSDRARVEPRPGVVPPKVSGVPSPSGFDLVPGRVASIGSVRFWIEGEGGRAPATAPSKRAGQARVAARQRRARRGLPGWLIVGLALAGVGVVGLVVKRAFEGEARRGASPVWATLAAVEEHLLHGNLDIAERKLNELPAAEIRPEEQRRIEELRRGLAAEREQQEIDSANFVGTKYFDVMLARYEKKWLAGTPSSSKIRLFLERCKEFRERWPQHPQLDWVDRNEARFRGHVDLSTPPTWEDITWELKYLVEQSTRDYLEAFRIVDEYLARVGGEELVVAKERRDLLVEERAAYFEDLMAEARSEYDEKDDVAQAVWWLVHGVIWTGDPTMADRAARTLVKIPGLVDHLRGYQREHPERLALLLENAHVRAYAEANGFSP